MIVYEAFHDLVPFVQLKKNMKNTHGGMLLLVKLKPAALLKVALLHGSFHDFLNCTNGTKRATHRI